MSFRDCTKSLSHSSILLQGFLLCGVAGNFYECCCCVYCIENVPHSMSTLILSDFVE